jgi:hypothetical protein
MTFEPTFDSIDDKADRLPDLEGNPFGDGDEESDLAATGEKRQGEDAELAEGAVAGDLLGSERPYDELPAYGEQ